MESHDPLCYRHAEGKRRPLIDCDCRIITLARADERERIAQAIEAIPSWEDREGWLVLSYKDVLAVLSGGGDE